MKRLNRLFRLAKANPLATIGLFLILINAFMVIFAPWVAPYNPSLMTLSKRHTPPCWEHLLGTDFYGRDILSRIIYGSRISFSLGLSVVIGGLIVGVPIGLLSGYYGGKIDAVLMRLTDMVITFPQLLLAMAIMAMWGAGFRNVVFALTITGWTSFARIV